jgi:cholesterol transport system auxiliary component
MRAWLALLLGGVLAATLGACTGSFFKSNQPPPSTYLLSVKPRPAPGGAALPVDLTVVLPRVRTGLDTDRIAALYPDGKLDYFARARWSGPLDEVVQDLVLQSFRGRFRNVSTDTSAFSGGYWLELDVVDFQAEYDGSKPDGAPSVHVQLIARVGNAGDRRMLGHFEADARQPAADNRQGAVIAAYDDAANRALGEIVEDTTQTLAGLPASTPRAPPPP